MSDDFEFSNNFKCFIQALAVALDNKEGVLTEGIDRELYGVYRLDDEKGSTIQVIPAKAHPELSAGEPGQLFMMHDTKEEAMMAEFMDDSDDDDKTTLH
jgi:hypothetical protein